MTPQRRRQVEDALARTLEAPPGQRNKVLLDTCSRDPELMQAVQFLLGGGSAADLEETVFHSPEHPLPPPVRTEAESVRRIGKYELTRHLGGGMSDVYEARDTVIDRVVAVKLLSEALSQETHFRERFLREARLLGSISHDHIVHIYDFGEHQDRPYIVMEYLRGEDLAAALANNRVGNLDRRLDISRQVASALDYVHSLDIVHRDIKPSNVRIEPTGRVKLMDFGIARSDVSQLTVTGALLGTPHYISPEQLQGKPPTPRSDIYSFGIFMYELLTDKRPFEGEAISRILFQIVNEPVRLEPLRECGAPAAVIELIRRTTEKDPELRPRDMREVLAILDQRSTQETLELPPSHVWARSRRTRALLLSAGAVALAGAAVLFLMNQNGADAPTETTAQVEGPAADTPTPQTPANPALIETPPSAIPEQPAVQAQAKAAAPVRTPVAPTPQPPKVQPQPAPPPSRAEIETPAPRPEAAPAVIEPPKPAQAAVVVPPPALAPKEQPQAPAPKPEPTAADVWRDVDQNSVASLQGFIKRFPNTPFAELASVRLEALAWRQVPAGDAGALRAFLSRFPQGAHADEATQKIQAIEGAASARQAILAALQRYEAAYRDKNLGEVAAVRPQLARAELDQIREFFRTARTINLQLRPTGEMNVNGDQAIVTCARTLVFVDNVGTSRRTEDQATIRLRRAGTSWVIAAFE